MIKDANVHCHSKAATVTPNVQNAQSDLAAFMTGTAAFVLAPVGFTVFVAVDEGLDDGVPEAVAFVEFNCSSGTMTAASTCIRPLCVLFP